MLERILVPLDGSPLSDRILVHVRRLLHAVDGEVTLLRVVERAALADEAREHLDQVEAALHAEGARATTRVVVGEPAARIIDVATEIEPSLIAMATHGRTGLGRAFLGTVCGRVLASSRWPLLLANPLALEEPDTLRFRKILVPLDGGEASSAILPAAAELARLLGAELETVHVAEGPPVAGILDAIDEEPVDLVAMVASDRGAIERWINGSVSDPIIRRSRCPVLIARAGAAAPLTRSTP